MFGKKNKLGDPLPKELAIRQEEEVLSIAQAWASENKRAWPEPVHAEYCFKEDGHYWLVRCNAFGRGSTSVMIDDTLGKVIDSRTLPR